MIKRVFLITIISSFIFTCCNNGTQSNNEIKLWFNGNSYTAVYNNTIFDGTGDFFIGSIAGAVGFIDGKASLCFLSQMAASDAIAFSVYEQQRAAFVR